MYVFCVCVCVLVCVCVYICVHVCVLEKYVNKLSYFGVIPIQKPMLSNQVCKSG